MGASLLVLANKRDLPNCISLEDIGTVHFCRAGALLILGSVVGGDSDASFENIRL